MYTRIYIYIYIYIYTYGITKSTETGSGLHRGPEGQHGSRWRAMQKTNGILSVLGYPLVI